jgi:hypothetical protein
MTQPQRPYGHLKNGDGATEVNVDAELHEYHHWLHNNIDTSFKQEI